MLTKNKRDKIKKDKINNTDKYKALVHPHPSPIFNALKKTKRKYEDNNKENDDTKEKYKDKDKDRDLLINLSNMINASTLSSPR